MNTSKKHVDAVVLATIGLAMSGAAQAALQGRDLDGNAATFEAYYDTDLNITWLKDANYAQTSGYDTDGKMTWSQANTWAANLSFTDGVHVYDNWRLPTVNPVNGTSFNINFSYNGSTDVCFNVNPASSEMAHLYFTELGNLSTYTASGALSGAYAGGANPNSTLDNTGPFTNFQSDFYWYGTEFASLPAVAWGFGTNGGYQNDVDKTLSFYALAVSPGDVAAVPEADTWAMLLAGLGLIRVVTGRLRG